MHAACCASLDHRAAIAAGACGARQRSSCPGHHRSSRQLPAALPSAPAAPSCTAQPHAASRHRPLASSRRRHKGATPDGLLTRPLISALHSVPGSGRAA